MYSQIIHKQSSLKNNAQLNPRGSTTARHTNNIHNVETNNDAIPPLRPESTGLVNKNSKLKCPSPLLDKSKSITNGIHEIARANSHITIRII